ncbi:hypothetical protein BDV95DRAFT_487646, partial [Massariosphaeria phaeospora]
DDQLLSPEEASINVDALVNDSDYDVPNNTISANNQTLEPPRRATPTVPPGFAVPALPRSPANEPPSRPTSRNASHLTPAIPILPITPLRAAATPARAREEKQSVGVPETRPSAVVEPPTVAKSKAELPLGRAKSENVPEVATKNVHQLPALEQNVHSVGVETPTKETSKGKVTSKKSQDSIKSLHKDKRDDYGTAARQVTPKRQHPGKLDIAAAIKLPEDEQSSATNSLKTDAPPKSLRAVSLASTMNSVPASPAATSTGSPVKRSTAPRTLRVVPTPKAEFPPPLSAVSVTSLPHVPVVDKLRSRQASIASLNQPGTPASDLISDTASVTSASISRASSPPPPGGKVGTAPVRKKTKSQQKKDRQERARQIAEEQAMLLEETAKSETEPVQAPIVGRKKKAKKPTTHTKSTPVTVQSQPASPKPPTVQEQEEEVESNTVASISTKNQSNKVPPSPPGIAQPSPYAEPPSPFEQPKEKGEPTAQSIIADLQRTGELLASTLEFFKPLSSSLSHASRTSQAGATGGPPDRKIQLSEADLDALTKKMPLRLSGKDGKSDSRTLITPQGKFFWGLTQELEEKALELEKHIEDLKGQAKFHPRKQTALAYPHNVSTHAQSKDVLPAIATALKEAGAKLSKSAASSSGQPMPKLDHTATLLGSTALPLPPVQTPSDGMPWLDLTKSPQDLSSLPPLPPSQPQPHPQSQTPADAITYLNQFVLPRTDNPSPNATRPEMAAVGGPPGAGMANMSVNVNKIAKAAKVVAEGGALGNELEGLGVMAADLLGGVVVQGLEALVGASLEFHSHQDVTVDGHGNVTMGAGGRDVQGFMNAIETGGTLGGFGATLGGHATRRGRKSVLSVEEAEQAMLAAKKDHDALEKKLAGLMKRNKKMVAGTGKT